MQWHPLFAKVLRSIVQDYYDVETNVPVGDAPRAADIVLVRRTSSRPPPFQTLLSHLTTWNIVEFKGRSVSARVHDLDRLVELGLGIDRRLNEERTRRGTSPIARTEVSIWYIANHLGVRFVRQAGALLGQMEQVSPGIWRSQLLRRSLFLVDGRTVPVDRESFALHLVGEESRRIEEDLARVIVEEPGYWERYAPFLGVLHPRIFDEANRMATTKRKSRGLDLRPFIQKVGVEKFIQVMDMDEIIANVDPKKLLKALGVKQIAAQLDARERKELKELLG